MGANLDRRAAHNNGRNHLHLSPEKIENSSEGKRSKFEAFTAFVRSFVEKKEKQEVDFRGVFQTKVDNARTKEKKGENRGQTNCRSNGRQEIVTFRLNTALLIGVIVFPLKELGDKQKQ